MENENKICVSIGNTPFDAIPGILAQVGMAEIRLDLANFSDDELKTIFSSHNNLIATCREGEYDDLERGRLLENAVRFGAAWIDIEADAETGWRDRMIKLARTSKTGLILSRHYYTHTPPGEDLKKDVDGMFDMGADIVKIATQVNLPSEAAELLGLYAKYNSIVAVGMGPLGVITRLASPFLGAPFTFASFGENPLTATGQIEYSEMTELIEKISSYG